MPTIVVHRDGRRVLGAKLVDGDTIGRSPTCAIVIADPAIAPVHATVRFPDDGDDIALYVAPGASANVLGEIHHGRVALWSPACVFQLGPFVVAIDDVPIEVPTDFTIPIVTEVTAGPTYTPHDAVEAELLASLHDDAAREVYADWLEARGYALRAKLLRAENVAAQDAGIAIRLDTLAPPGDVAWRAVTSRAPVDRCVTFRTPCDKRWSELAPTEYDRVRFCGTCERNVFYCATVEDARRHGRDSECIAIDAAVARGEALEAYDETDDLVMGGVGEDT